MLNQSGKKFFVCTHTFVRALGVLLVFYLNRHYSKDDYGKIIFFLITGTLLTSFLDFGILQTTTRELSQKIKKPIYYINRSLEMKMFLLCAIGLIYILGLWGNMWNMSTWHFLLLWWAFSQSLLLTYFGIKRSQMQFMQEAIIIIALEFSFVGTSIILAISGFGIISIGIAISLLSSCIVVLLLIIHREHINKINCRYFQIFKERKVLKITISFVVLSMCYHLTYRLDTLMVKLFTTYQDLSSYEVASSIARNLRIIPSGISIIFFSMIASSRTPKNTLALIKKFLAIIFIMAIVVLIMQLTIGDSIITFVFTNKYKTSIPVMHIYSFTVVPVFLNLAIMSTLSALCHNNYTIIINLVIIFFTFSANILMIPTLGISGAAYSSVISESLALFVGLYFLQKVLYNKKEVSYSSFHLFTNSSDELSEIN